MAETPRLMAVLAHPDDESLGIGGTLACYGAEGVETYLVTATRGERGWTGDERDYPGSEALGRIREAELRAAAKMLGVCEVAFLDYLDGELDRADPLEAVGRIVGHLRRVKPQAVVTFGPDGDYGHPDHIAICQLTTAAVTCAADSSYVDSCGQTPHRVGKLYYKVASKDYVTLVHQAIGEVAIDVDGVKRRFVGWEDWAVSARIDATAHWRTVLGAILCHESQLATLGPVAGLPEEVQRELWGRGTYFRASSLVNGGRRVEEDLFAGLR